MISKEILNEIRFIEFESKKILNSMGAGAYSSTFKGQGMEFSEVREYVPGDDTRHIDWNITAKTGIPHTKKFVEEREMTLLLAVDMSSSGNFSSQLKSKKRFMASISTLLSLYATSNNDQVGLLIFTDTIETYIPPGKGKQHVLRITRELLCFDSENKKTDINIALEHLLNILKKRSTIFLLSDFYSPSFTSTLKVVSQKHSLIALDIHDPREQYFPKIGLIDLIDSETNQTITVDTSHPVIQELSTLWNQKQKDLKSMLFNAKADYVSLSFKENFSNSIRPLLLFFKRSLHKKY